MKVKDLIKELKKMPQNLEVGMAAHDNAEYEVSGWVSSVWHIEKGSLTSLTGLADEKQYLEDMPEEWVVIGP
jgi:hypothetical protein